MESFLTFVCISDTHSQDYKLKLPEGDVLIHCGDFSKTGNDREITDFINWLKLQPFKYKVVIAGNHDLALDIDRYQSHLKHRFHPTSQFDEKKLLQAITDNSIYLVNKSVTIEGIKIWGSPYSLEFCDWGFQLDPKDAKQFWTQIEEDTDIVVTHGPSFGHGDQVGGKKKQNVGDIELLKRIKQIKAKYHLFGHVHEGYGQTEEDGIQFINCSILNEYYKFVNQPIVFKLPKKQIVK